MMFANCTRLLKLVILLGLVLSSSLLADYLWPLPYGNDLSSSFGNWRARRYHLGLDIRTGGIIGRPVVAPRSGYIYRVRADYRGYGRALYLKMDNGDIAVFGHLSRFRPEVNQYLRQNQLADESYHQDLYPLKDQFSYNRGDTIAWSGSTGVGAPHLHFEIRTPDNTPVNPVLLPGLSVPDAHPPEFHDLILIGSIDNELAEALGYSAEYKLALAKGDSLYRLDEPLRCPPFPFWLAVSVTDRIGRNNWAKSVYSIELRQGSRTLYRHVYDTTSFAENYLIDERRNYGMALQNRRFFENLVDDSMIVRANGICDLISDYAKPVEIIATDAKGNISRAEILLEPGASDGKEAASATPDYDRLRSLIERDGILKDSLLVAFRPAGDSLILLLEDLTNSNDWFDIIDLQDHLTRARKLGNGYYIATVHHAGTYSSSDTLARYVQIRRLAKSGIGAVTAVRPDYLPGERLASGKLRWFSTDGRVEMISDPPERMLFPIYRNDYFKITPEQIMGDTNYAIVPHNIALRKSVLYRYHFPAAIPAGAGLYSVGDDSVTTYVEGASDSADGTIEAANLWLSDISMRIDTMAPSIRDVTPGNRRRVTNPRPQISATLSDTLSGIEDKIEVRVDGAWLIPDYDFESGIVKAKPHFNLKPGNHRLDIIVTDRAGNERHYKGNFTFVN
jgi:hypothetical protein